MADWKKLVPFALVGGGLLAYSLTREEEPAGGLPARQLPPSGPSTKPGPSDLAPPPLPGFSMEEWGEMSEGDQRALSKAKLRPYATFAKSIKEKAKEETSISSEVPVAPTPFSSFVNTVEQPQLVSLPPAVFSFAEMSAPRDQRGNLIAEKSTRDIAEDLKEEDEEARWRARKKAQVQAYESANRMYRDVIRRDEVKASELVAALKGRYQKEVMTLRYTIGQAEEWDTQRTGRLDIYIDTWDSFKVFANMLTLAFLVGGIPARKRTKDQMARALHIVKWFRYHRFFIDPKGAVFQGLTHKLNEYMCHRPPHPDGRLCSFFYEPQKGWDCEYPGVGFKWSGDACNAYAAATNKKIVNVLNDPLQLMIEYASIKASNVWFAAIANPQLSAIFTQQIQQSVMGAASIALGVAGVLLGTAGSMSAVPVVGWIGAGIAATAAAVASFMALGSMKEQNKQIRAHLSRVTQTILTEWFEEGKIKDTYSGYYLDVLLPSVGEWDDTYIYPKKDPLANNVPGYTPKPTLDADLYHHFCLVNSAEIKARAVPQLPFFYLNIDFDLIVSLAVPSQNFLILQPVKNPNRLSRSPFGFFDTVDFVVREKPQSQAKTINFGDIPKI